jgi:hypothetical protein
LFFYCLNFFDLFVSRNQKDIEKEYSNEDFVEKLRRLADALEKG